MAARRAARPRSGRPTTAVTSVPGAASRSAARLVLALVVVGVGLLAGARPAAAHAELSSSNPADGAVLEQSPSTVTLQFTEPVTVQADGLRIIDAEGDAVETGPATADGELVVAAVDGALPQGGYLVAWRAVSADGHPIRGAFSFSVGVRTELRSGLADDAFTGSSDRRDEVTGAVLRGLTYLGVLGSSGAVLVGSVLHRRGDPTVVSRTVSVLALVGLGALLLQIPVQASLATGRGWGSLGDDGVVDLVLGDGLGMAVAVTAVGLLALIVTAGLLHEGAARRLYVAGAVIAPLGLPLTGHTRTMSPAAVGYLADGVHVLAAAVWFGGLLALLSVVRRRRAAGDPWGAADGVARFSGLAGLATAAVVVAGVTLAWIEVRGLDALVSTTYGRLLLAKVALVGAVLAGAAWNRYRLLPALRTTVSGRDHALDGEPGSGVRARDAGDRAGAGDGDADGDGVDGNRLPAAVGAVGASSSGPSPTATSVAPPEAIADRSGAGEPVARASHVPGGDGIGADPAVQAPIASHDGSDDGSGDGSHDDPGDRPGRGDEDGDAAGDATGDGAVWSMLLRVVRFEALALLAVLALTGVIANVTPARSADDGGGIVSVSAPLGTGTMEVVVDPATPGRNDVHVYLLDGGGSSDDRYQEAAFRLALPEQDLGPLDREPVRAGPGHFQLVGTDLDLAGEWTLTVTVKPDRFTELSATVRFEVR